MYETVLRIVLKNKIYAAPLAANNHFVVAEPPTDKYSPYKCH
jgi:hypothetical protein